MVKNMPKSSDIGKQSRLKHEKKSNLSHVLLKSKPSGNSHTRRFWAWAGDKPPVEKIPVWAEYPA